MTRIIVVLAAMVAPLMSCGVKAADIDTRLAQIELQPGFVIDVYTQGVANARQ